MQSPPITREQVAATYELIRAYIRRTPTIEVDLSDFGLSAHALTCKLELLQHAGSFKPRGAFANLLTRPVPEAGVVAASGGNHGLAVAFASSRLRIPATIFVPGVAAATKRERIQSLELT
jgi:threonine dehydratase